MKRVNFETCRYNFKMLKVKFDAYEDINSPALRKYKTNSKYILHFNIYKYEIYSNLPTINRCFQISLCGIYKKFYPEYYKMYWKV